MNKHVLSCDWGTSSFRLRLVETDGGRVLGEQLSANGIAATFSAWKVAQQRENVAQEAFFCRFLSEQIQTLSRSVPVPTDGLPVVLSGMASSSIGLAEVPYASLPFALDGSQVSVRRLSPTADFNHSLLLIAGVSSANDVMRGEETQLIGLGDELPDLSHCVLVFPGTHSKHMYVRRQQLIDFHTYMTGELFGALVQHTILKESTDTHDLTTELRRSGDVFGRGVQASATENVLRSLFSVRTNQLFGRVSRAQNALYLSGLLIGTELRRLQQQPDWHVVLCCDNNLVDFYGQAITLLGLADRTTRIAADRIRQSAIAGHLKIMDQQTLSVAARR